MWCSNSFSRPRRKPSSFATSQLNLVPLNRPNWLSYVRFDCRLLSVPNYKISRSSFCWQSFFEERNVDPLNTMDNRATEVSWLTGDYVSGRGPELRAVNAVTKLRRANHWNPLFCDPLALTSYVFGPQLKVRANVQKLAQNKYHQIIILPHQPTGTVVGHRKMKDPCKRAKPWARTIIILPRCASLLYNAIRFLAWLFAVEFPNRATSFL